MIWICIDLASMITLEKYGQIEITVTNKNRHFYTEATDVVCYCGKINLSCEAYPVGDVCIINEKTYQDLLIYKNEKQQ